MFEQCPSRITSCKSRYDINRYYIICKKGQSITLPEHVRVLQFSLQELDPTQLRPPQEGAGQLQLLDRYLVPEPHDLLQADQAAQEPQLPFTLKASLDRLTFNL